MCVYYVYTHIFTHACTNVVFFSIVFPLDRSETKSQRRKVSRARPHSKEWAWGLNTVWLQALSLTQRLFSLQPILQLGQIYPLPNERIILGNYMPSRFFLLAECSKILLVFSALDYPVPFPRLLCAVICRWAGRICIYADGDQLKPTFSCELLSILWLKDRQAVM